MKAIKVGGVALGLATLLYLLLVNFSATSSRYECAGDLTSSKLDLNHRTTAYFKLDEYRPWVRLWGDSDGDMHVEVRVPDVALYYSNLERLGDLYLIRDNQTPKGSFSKLSNTLKLQVMEDVTFIGQCSRMKH